MMLKVFNLINKKQHISNLVAITGTQQIFVSLFYFTSLRFIKIVTYSKTVYSSIDFDKYMQSYNHH